ncbi:uncharacterized protein LOC134528156 [Bacillus rossius redtenbacheri]|uniref:uncharacterized protein LOC134528156 n=1 Tax=Bacillus rossius redtenbacheri TaxID=93214 RepID=UPI002FDD85AD
MRLQLPETRSNTLQGRVQVGTCRGRFDLERLTDLNGYRLPAAVYESPLYGIVKRSSENGEVGFSGRAGLLMKELVRHMNVTPVYVTPEHGFTTGYRMDNGTLVGTLALFASGRVEILLNTWLMMGSKTDIFTYIPWPITQDSLCAYVPLPGAIPPWFSLLLGLSFKSEMYCLVVYFTFVILWLLWGNNQKEQSIVSTNASIPLFYKDIRTLEELYISGLHIFSSYHSHIKIFNSENPVIKRLSTRFNVSEQNEDELLPRVAHKKDIAYIYEASRMMEIVRNYSDSSGMNRIKMVPECFQTYLVTFIARPNTPFLPRFKRIVGGMVEAGLFAADRATRPRPQDVSLAEASPGLSDLTFSFLVLGLGVCSSLAALALESRRPCSRLLRGRRPRSSGGARELLQGRRGSPSSP